MNTTRAYSVLRRFQGDNSMEDYARDVTMLAGVLREMQLRGFLIVWLAATPQHFRPMGHLMSTCHQLGGTPALTQLQAGHRCAMRCHHLKSAWRLLFEHVGGIVWHPPSDCTHFRARGLADVPYFMAHVVTAAVKVLMS